ncbi:MAG TPA: DegT/DnrJ/EryC1/StrS family aminotransferase, partial [Ignavibacteriaceae bacterium]|nr:DegT/DnrJ/EryC1/StrS family aminotransferase [Ignavibacteriaceae bacterium]
LLKLEETNLTRDELLLKLHLINIGTGVHYRAIHFHPYYKNTFGYREGEFPNSEFISYRTLSLPFSAKLTDEDVSDVINGLKEILS